MFRYDMSAVKPMFDNLPMIVVDFQSILATEEAVPTRAYDDKPIDVALQIETTAMCCNRQFPESGITRAIVDRYNDYLVQDVIERILMIGKSFGNVQKTESKDIRIQEVAQYVSFYRHDDLFMLNAMAALSFLALKLEHEDFICKVLTCTNGAFIESARRQIYPHGMGFVTLLSASIFYSADTIFLAVDSGPWSQQFFDQLVDTGLVDILLATLDDALAMDRSEYIFKILRKSFESSINYMELRMTEQQDEIHPQLEQGLAIIRDRLRVDAGDDIHFDNEDGNYSDIDDDLDYDSDHVPPYDFGQYDMYGSYGRRYYGGYYDDEDNYDPWWDRD
ncbi:hypothetical protein MPSEU_000187600 [Mayamaea pseudoterrestris]|nr:hypothetical protein MPSEU_000187600 [Mayamaea pseudoterrestris]